MFINIYMYAEWDHSFLGDTAGIQKENWGLIGTLPHFVNYWAPWSCAGHSTSLSLFLTCKIQELLPASEELRKIIGDLCTTKHCTNVRDYYYWVES